MPDDTTLLEGLTPEERHELELRRYVKVGKDLIWIELDGCVQREPASRLYYIQTARGIFRVSRIHGRVIEV
jgi:hypothetical protein